MEKIRFSNIIRLSILFIFIFPVISLANDIDWFRYDGKISEQYSSANVQVEVITDENGDIDFINNSSTSVYMRVLVMPIVTDNGNKIESISKDEINIKYNNEFNESILDHEYWHESEDGYYYYKYEIKANEVIDNKFIKEISLNTNKNIKLDIVTEVIQSRNNAYKELWNIK